jgi:ribonuclease T1
VVGSVNTPIEKAASAEQAAAETPTPSIRTQRPEPRGPPGIPLITLGELPVEALYTIDLIQRGGPFPYYKDGSTFQNRERLLPNAYRGYYAEYTVDTPGSDDRGARRIVAGEDGELYYTEDHYNSFFFIQGASAYE